MSKEAILENQTKLDVENSLALKYLPGYACFIRDTCIVPYIQEQINIARAINLPMLKFFEGVPDEELIAMAMVSHKEFLGAVEQNRVKEHLLKAFDLWRADKLSIIKREEITAEDITFAGYIRKKALLKFLPEYTSDIHEAIEIIKEIDTITLEGDTAATNIYINLLKDRINDRIETEKETARKLAENEEILLKANEIAHVGNWTWDLITGQIEWSDELYKIYGVTRDFDLAFEKVMAFTDVEDHARMTHNLKLCKETLQPSETYYHIRLNDGTQKVLHAKTEAIPGNSGNIDKMIGVIQDVTEKQLLIERLQNSETLYKQAQAIGRIGNWSWDLVTRKLEWSDELYRIYEMERQPIDYSGDIATYNHPEDATLIRDTIRHSIETLEPFDFTYRIILKTGKIKTVHAKGEIKTGLDDVANKIYGTLQDITEQKSIEKQLQGSREFTNKIADVTPSLIAAYNIHTGKYSFINKAIETMLGYPVSKVMEEGVPFFISIIHPDDLIPLMDKNSKALEEANRLKDVKNEPVVEFKYRMKNVQGEYRWFQTYGTIFERDKNGQIESVLNVSIDVTGQEVAEQALFQKNMELQQSNSSLEEYAYVASHDLKEPLRKISTFSGRLLSMQNDSLNEETATYLNKIISSANRMQQMIDDLLSVSTILGNNIYETCDLDTVLNEALQSLDYKIEESKAIIESDKLPTIRAVPSQFRQLFQNLVNNSLKFARKDLPPHIKISHQILKHDGASKYNLTQSKKYLQIDVEDNGIGFDNEYANKIFTIFQRLHSKSDYEGTGIGLAICKKIVENHGGIIFANGTPEHGAVFTIIIPV